MLGESGDLELEPLAGQTRRRSHPGGDLDLKT
jgi:hypothetical protein